MGRKSVTSGVRAKGKSRIQFDFEFEGQRYGPTLRRPPTEGNLRRALKQLEGIRERIAAGTFSFVDEFPDYKLKEDLSQVKREREERQKKERTCTRVFDQFIAHCEMRVAMNDMAFSTLNGYRKILDAVWKPEIGSMPFETVATRKLWQKTLILRT